MKTRFGPLILAALLAAPAFGGDRVFLVYDEQQISDTDRATVTRLLCRAVKRDGWRSYQATEDWQLSTLIDLAYDYFLRDQNGNPAYPNTMDVIAREIIKQNKDKFPALPDSTTKNIFDVGVKSGTTLLIPRLPVRGEWANEDHPAMRVFRPDTNAYALVKDAGDPERAALPVPTDKNESNATADHPYRKVRFTAVEIPNWAILEAAMEIDETLQIPSSVIVRTESPMVTLTLLDDAAPCPNEPSKLVASPHLAMIGEAIERYRQRVKDILDKKEAVRALWIVDWDVDKPHGHGAKVTSVVNSVLDDLTFDLRLKQTFVHRFDLNPRNNGPELKKTLDAYEQYYRGSDANFATSILPRAFTAAANWIAHPTADQANAASELDHDINEFVLQAVLWRFLNQEEAFVNMSFTIAYPAGQPLNARFMEGAQSFAAIAAGNGNDQHPYVLPGSYPQMGANTYPNLINVTYGTADGRVLGSRMGPGPSVVVDLVAPGCGFEHDGVIMKSDTGSSFASPFVAVTAWIKAICEQITPKEMKPLLQNANRLSAYRDVASHGVYDPALLYMPQTLAPHLIDNSGKIASLVGATLDGEYFGFDADAKPHALPLTFDDHITGGHLAVFPCDPPLTDSCMLYKPDRDHPVQLWRAGTFRLKLSGSTAPSSYTAQEFAMFKDICF